MRLATELHEVIMGAQSEAIFISPYYVPGEGGVQMVRDLIAQGVRVIILTNSLASTNHVPVHAAYARYRKAVIQAGAELYEARANAARDMVADKDGPDTLTLHTKAFIIDRRKLFVGSLNLDPRSIELNAEMGLLIDFAGMVADMTADLKHGLATLTYRVRLNDRGKLEWHARIDDRDVIETKEPLTGWWRRFKAWCMKIAPESQL
jgi:putative cardiolipin synthase